MELLVGTAATPLGISSAFQADALRFSVDVDLVMLHVTVQGRKGGFVSGLRQDAFEVYEDGRAQAIRLFRDEDVPVTVGMVVDNSGSMRSKRNDVIAAALAFARSSNPADEMFLVYFNEHVWLGLREGLAFTNQRDELEAALDRMVPSGRTALYDAIATGLDHLAGATRDKKVLIAVSDGGDNASHHTFDDVRRMAERSNSIIYTIGLFDADDPDNNPKALARLAADSGGESFLPRNIHAVVDVCERIARDIRNQYSIGYSSDNPTHDGRYRKIKVVLKSPFYHHARVRVRAGYLAPGA